MFDDYYYILGVSVGATQDQIKSAYRQLALKYHPDKNSDRNAGEIMRRINEAYFILKDPGIRARYDEAYLRYKAHFEDKDKSAGFEVKDRFVFSDKLKEDIRNAKRMASELAEKGLKELIEMLSDGIGAVRSVSYDMLIAWILSGILFSVLAASCQK